MPFPLYCPISNSSYVDISINFATKRGCFARSNLGTLSNCDRYLHHFAKLLRIMCLPPGRWSGENLFCLAPINSPARCRSLSSKRISENSLRKRTPPKSEIAGIYKKIIDSIEFITRYRCHIWAIKMEFSINQPEC